MAAPGLTACLVVRDERAALEAMLPDVVAAADEVVVVDTGSRDGTADLARTLGAKVVVQLWADDFARARNRALDEVRTSHFLWIDVDERITRDDVAAVRKETLAHPERALELIVVTESADPDAVTSCWQLRVAPVAPGHRFAGRVRETLRPGVERNGTPVVRLPIAIHDAGHRDSREALRKARRDHRLLRIETEARPDDARLRYFLARTAARLGLGREARRAARRCLALAPAGEIGLAAAALLGRLELERGHSAEAETVLRAAIDHRPDDAPCRFLLGDFLRRRGDFRGALRELRTARAAPLRRGSVPLPAAGLARRIRQRLGEVLEVLERPAEAAVAYREILDDHPDRRATAIAHARALLAAGARDDAERALDRLPGGARDDADALVVRAHLALARGADAEARETFARAGNLAPENWTVPLHLGHLAFRQGDTARALDHYLKALALADEPEVRVALAAVRLERGELADALGELETVFDGCPGRPLPRGTEALAGEALLRRGRAREALRAFERHLERTGPDARVVARLADCYRALGGAEAARLGYEEALRLHPELPEARRGLAALAGTGP